MRFRDRDITLLLITLLGTLSFVDVLTTSFLLRRGMSELNPFISPFAYDPALFLAVKLLGSVIIIGLVLGVRVINHWGDHLLLGAVCCMSVFPIIWNILLF